MIVNTGDLFIYLKFEQADFRLVGGQQKYEPILAALKAAIPEQERQYVREDKMWVIEKNTTNVAIVEELEKQVDAEET